MGGAALLVAALVGPMLAGPVLAGSRVTGTATSALAPRAPTSIETASRLPTGTTPTPPAEPDETTADGALVGVELTDVAPVVATAGDVLSISGTVRNSSDQTLSTLNAYLRMSRVPTTERSEIDQLDDPGFRPGFRPGPFVPVVASLPPGAAAQFRLDIPVPELGLTGPGIYPVGIEVLAGLEDGGRDVVGEARTVLPWLPPDSGAGTVGVTLAVPLSAAVDRAPDGTYLSDELGALLAPAGGLATPFDLPAGPAVSWLVDPALVEAAVDLADGYEVRADPADAASAAPGEHAEDAVDWLATLSERVTTGSVALLPYGNPDAVALVRAGMEADVVTAVEAAPDVLAQLELDGDPFAGAGTDVVVYPPDGLVDAATLQVVGGVGVREVVLAESALASTGEAPQVATLDAGGVAVTAATTDAALHDVLAAGQGSLQTRQLLLAHTAMAALAAGTAGTAGTAGPEDALTDPEGDPDPARAQLVLVPPQPLPADVAEALAVLAEGAPWLTAVPLATALAPSDAAATVRYPDTNIAAELDQGYLGEVRALQRRTELLVALTGEESTGAAAGAGADRDLARLRTESAAWRGDLERARAVVDVRAAALDATLGRVRIVTTGTVTLSSDSGRFPLTVANDLDVPVTVGVRLTPSRPARLQTTTPQTIEVASGARTTVDVSARATANGTYLVAARLQTTAGEPFGLSTTIELRATAYDTVAWIVMGAAGGLLVVGSGLRIARRLRS